VARLRRDESNVKMLSYNRASPDIIDRFALHDKTGVESGAVSH
jgi:SulP family sulfate permease